MRAGGILNLCGMLAAALAVQSCSGPSSRVTLYEEYAARTGQGQTASRRKTVSVFAPVPRAKPRRHSARIVTLAAASPSRGGAPADTPVTTFDKAARSKYQAVPADGRHRVRAKETVYAVSRRFGVPVRSLIRLNNLKPPFALRRGQSLRVPAQKTHVVAKGETVYAISRRYDLSLKELVRLNAVAEPYTIKTGQTLLLPDSERQSRPPSAVAIQTPPADAGKLAQTPIIRRPVLKDAPVARGRPKRVVLPPSNNIPRPARLSGRGFLWPIAGKVISGFGPKGKGLHNDGINIAARRGAAVRAAQNGVVVYRGNELRGFGKLILIRHAKGYMTAYGHNSKLLVKRGQKVKRGQVIARVGSTGSVAKPQLHFEIRRGRRAVNPLRFLRNRRAERPHRVAARG